MNADQVVVVENQLSFRENDRERLCLRCTPMEGTELAEATALLNLLINGEILVKLDFEDVLRSFSDALEVFVAMGSLKELEKFCGAVHSNAIIGLALNRKWGEMLCLA